MKMNLLILSLLFFFASPSFSQEVLTVPHRTSSILPIFNQRHSGRSYDASRSVSTDQILVLAEAARAAPSSYNEQPWFYFLR